MPSATISVLDATGTTQTIEKPITPGAAAAADSRPVTLSTENVAILGAINETAPASDTASAGHNGRLQRIAQNISSLITLLTARLPAALGGGGGLKIDGSGTALPVSGTFWQATQPVSGTFWQATQPVSLASVPSHAVTNAGTFAVQATLQAGSAIAGKVGIDQTTPGTTNGVQVNAALPAGANVVGKVGIDQTTPGTTNGVALTAAVPAGTNLIGQVSAGLASDQIMVAGVAVTPKFAVIQAASSGDNSIVSAVVGKKIRVLSLWVNAAGTVNAKFRSATTDISGLLYGIANVGMVLPFNPAGHFETASNAALQVNLSAAIAVGGSLTYIEV